MPPRLPQTARSPPEPTPDCWSHKWSHCYLDEPTARSAMRIKAMREVGVPADHHISHTQSAATCAASDVITGTSASFPVTRCRVAMSAGSAPRPAARGDSPVSRCRFADGLPSSAAAAVLRQAVSSGSGHPCCADCTSLAGTVARHHHRSRSSLERCPALIAMENLVLHTKSKGWCN